MKYLIFSDLHGSIESMEKIIIVPNFDDNNIRRVIVLNFYDYTEKGTSLLSSILIAFLICFFGFVAQDRIDAVKEIKELNKHIDELLTQINHKDIYAMTEIELYEHCRSCGLDDVDCKIARLIVIERLKGQELYEAIGYSERQTKRKRKKILK